MTDDEKLGCLDGDTEFWSGIIDMVAGGYHGHPWPAAVVDRLGIPGIHFADGPRGCVIGPATCFPVSMARGATFDPELEERIGRVIGAELRAMGATYTGAVCMNLLRHPGWGRAQETYGEDPHHVGEMAAALTRGLQTRVMACMKHFACNSMEEARFRVDVTVDERALHEVYLPHFRRVADEGVASVMSAYNSVNGNWCGENTVLLTDVLRTEWGWDGFVTSDFIAGLHDPVLSVTAGLEIEMPFRQQRAQHLPDAVASGRLAMADVEARVAATVATLLRFADVFGPAGDPSVLAGPDHRSLAREAAAASMVLLRNEGALLPVVPGPGRVTVLGRLAAVPNLGDGGSSDVYPPEVSTLLDGVRSAFPSADVVHHDSDALLATGADLAVVVVGCTKADEGEFIDVGTSESMMTMFPSAPGPPEPADGAPAGDDAVVDDGQPNRPRRPIRTDRPPGNRTRRPSPRAVTAGPSGCPRTTRHWSGPRPPCANAPWWRSWGARPWSCRGSRPCRPRCRSGTRGWKAGRPSATCSPVCASREAASRSRCRTTQPTWSPGTRMPTPWCTTSSTASGSSTGTVWHPIGPSAPDLATPRSSWTPRPSTYATTCRAPPWRRSRSRWRTTVTEPARLWCSPSPDCPGRSWTDPGAGWSASAG